MLQNTIDLEEETNLLFIPYVKQEKTFSFENWKFQQILHGIKYPELSDVDYNFNYKTVRTLTVTNVTSKEASRILL